MPNDSPTDVSLSLKKGASGESVSFLDRRSWGLSNWLWLSVLVALTVAFIPRGARRAIESNTNKAEDWLPDNYAESADLQWFRDHFVGESFALVSWDGCTLGNAEKLRLLQQKLLAEVDAEGLHWYPRVVTGPGIIESLTQAPANLDRSTAIARLEGALVGPILTDAAGKPLEEASRTTCLIAYLADPLTANNRAMRRAVDRIEQIAHAECGVPLASIHMGGPPVDNVTIDKEGERTLMRLAGLSGIVGLVLSYLCFRSWKLTVMVFFLAVTSAGMSLALVFYYGVFEVLGLGLPEPHYGKTDAILMSMPAVVYVLGLSGAIHLVNYYREEREKRGQKGAAERAVSIAWGPCLLASFTTAVGLGSLATSDILPIRKFGMFTAIGVVASVGLLFALLPVLLHSFPPSDASLRRKRRDKEPDAEEEPEKAPWYTPLSHFVTTRHALTTAGCLTLMLALAAGIPQIQTSVKLLKLLDPSCDLITDYEWLEQHLGNLVPMEVIVALDSAQMRSPDEPAELPLDAPDTDGRVAYRMTLFERAQLSRRLQSEIESLGPVSRALSATTFSPAPTETGTASLRKGVERINSLALEEARDDLYEYLQKEVGADGKPTGRELWRISARVTALGDVDYGQFVTALRGRVEPLLEAYRARDAIVAKLHSGGKLLDKARVCVLFPSEDAASKRPAEGSVEARLITLLKESAGRRVKVSALSTARLAEADEAGREHLTKILAGQDALIALSPEVASTAATLQEIEPLVLLPHPSGESAIAGKAANVAVYTGVVPLVFKTQRELLASLRRSIGWATVLIAGVMVLVLRSPTAGIASMIPNVFPIVTVFGTLGWLGVKVDIGIMMTASVALGVAVDDTLHFVTWFGRGVRSGLDRQTATRQAFDRCATAMLQTTLIAGLGLAVFVASTFTPTQQFGSLMITMLGTALVGDLILLPALLCGPLGRFFAPGVPALPPIDSEAMESTDSSEDLPAIVPFPPAVGSNDLPDGEAEIGTGETTVEQADAPLSPENAALQKKLRGFRRSSS